MAIYSKGFNEYIGQNLNKKWSDIVDLSDTLPVLTTYPTADPSKIGKKFMYRGIEWKYFSKEELIDMSLVGFPPGFPAPVSDTPDVSNILNVVDGKISLHLSKLDAYEAHVQIYGNSDGTVPKIEIDFLFLRKVFMPNRLTNYLSDNNNNGKKTVVYILSVASVSANVTAIKNAALLYTLEDYGTRKSFNFATNDNNKFDISADVLNDFFKQLPSTTKTATLDVRGATGAATCTPSIATAKGYTVITT